MIVLILYFIAATIEIIGEFTENYQVIFYSKILLMPLLMIYAFTQQKQKSKIIFLLLGLFFSWFGDIFLMVRHQQLPENQITSPHDVVVVYNHEQVTINYDFTFKQTTALAGYCYYEFAKVSYPLAINERSCNYNNLNIKWHVNQYKLNNKYHAVQRC